MYIYKVHISVNSTFFYSILEVFGILIETQRETKTVFSVFLSIDLFQ